MLRAAVRLMAATDDNVSQSADVAPRPGGGKASG
jgi:hypothetical protein